MPGVIDSIYGRSRISCNEPASADLASGSFYSIVEQSCPLIGREVQVQAPQRSGATNGDRDAPRHASHDFRVEKDPTAGHLADLDQSGLVFASAAPTEPQVTNVSSATTVGVAIGDDERVAIGVLVEPAACLVIEHDGEGGHYEIMARQAGPRPACALLTNVYRTPAAAGISCSTTS